MRKSVVVVDPAVRVAEIDCFNRITQDFGQPTHYMAPVLRGDPYPAVEDVRAVVILGSGASVHEKLPWQLALEDWLRQLFALKVPVLGICYGHQLLAAMFGGGVGYLYPDQAKRKGLGTVVIKGSRIFTSGTYEVIVSHREVVTQLPTDFVQTGKSEVATCEAFEHRTMPIFCFQSHPEATAEFLSNQDIPVSLPGDGRRLVKEFLKYVSGS
jgi:GMP synthase-like glutamine amidotransferase